MRPHEGLRTSEKNRPFIHLPHRGCQKFVAVPVADDLVFVNVGVGVVVDVVVVSSNTLN